LFGDALPKTLSISGLVLAAIAAACLIRTDFTLEGKAKLRPSVRQHVFAQQDGDVQQVLVEHDSAVKKGDVLVVERNPDLEKEMEATRGQLTQAQADIESTNRSLIDDRDMTEADKSQKYAHVAQLDQQVISLQKQLEAQEVKKDLLQ